MPTRTSRIDKEPNHARALDGQHRRAAGARLVHHVPGRLRLKFDGAASPELFERLQHALSAFPGVSSVRVNAAAQSAVIHYDPHESEPFEGLAQNPQIQQVLKDAGVADLAEAAAPVLDRYAAYLQRHSQLAEAIVASAERLDTDLRRATDGYLDMKVLLPLAALAFSTIHKARTKGTPMWMTLCTFAFNAFTTLHRNRLDRPAGAVDRRLVH